MSAYLFQFELGEFTEELVATIPAHRQRINTLLIDGKLLSYSVSQSRTLIWCVITADDQQEAMELVLTFPLYRYFTDVLCHPLLFHHAMPMVLPGISLN